MASFVYTTPLSELGEWELESAVTTEAHIKKLVTRSA